MAETDEEKTAREAQEAETKRIADEAADTERKRLAALTTDELVKTIEKERADRQSANREAQTLRQRAKDLETKIGELTQGEQTELDKAKTRITELETQASDLSRRERSLQIRQAAVKLEFNDPGDAVGLLGDTEWKDDAELETKLKEIATAKPYLVKPQGNVPTRQTQRNPQAPGETEVSKQRAKEVIGQSRFLSNRYRGQDDYPTPGKSS